LNKTANKVLSTLIVDDEALARRGLKHRLSRIPGVHVIAEARNGREAIELIRKHMPDVVFLDIQMPGKNGFDVVRDLAGERMPSIVFVTAYDEFAIQAFKANAIDYVLKPIEEGRLQEALKRVRETLSQKQAVLHKKSLLKLVSNITGEAVSSMEDIRTRGLEKFKKKEVQKLAIKDGGKTTWVPQDQIEWIDAAGDYMCVHADGETHILRKTMKNLEAELDPEILQRIHRSTIVNINCVKEMRSHINGEYFLTLESGHTIKLSRTYKDKLRYFA